MKRSKWTTRLTCGALILVTITGAAVAAGIQGSQSDPLVTLSYLNEKVVPDILKQVDEHIRQKSEELEKKLQDQGPVGFVAVEAEAGKTMTLSAGTQLLLRSGAASGDGLVDTTAGQLVTGPLSANHLYIAAGEGQTVTVSEKAAFMVMGSYTVK